MHYFSYHMPHLVEDPEGLLDFPFLIQHGRLLGHHLQKLREVDRRIP